MNKLYLDLRNQNFEQTASTMSVSTRGHLEILKDMSTVSQTHTKHSGKENKILFFSNKRFLAYMVILIFKTI